MSEDGGGEGNSPLKTLGNIPDTIRAASANPLAAFALLAIISVLLFSSATEATRMTAFGFILVIFLVLLARIGKEGREPKAPAKGKDALGERSQADSQIKASLAADHVFSTIHAYDVFTRKVRRLSLAVPAVMGALVKLGGGGLGEVVATAFTVFLVLWTLGAMLRYFRRRRIRERLSRGQVDISRLTTKIECHTWHFPEHQTLFLRLIADS